MNELIFPLHICVVVGLVLGSLKVGKEALVATVALQAVLANLFVLKQMTLFGMTVTCSDVYIIGCTLALNLLQEYFGRPIVNKTIWISFFALMAFGILGQFQLAYAPAGVDTKHGAYMSLLSAQPRILFASLTAYLLVQLLDVRLFGTIRKKWPQMPLALRSGASLIICQAVDTVLFSFLGLYGLVANIGDIMIVSFLIKVGIIVCMTPFTQLSRRLA